MDDELYQEQILDHYQNPRNKKILKNATFQHHEYNPSCGDDLTIYVKIKKNQTIKVTFQGYGCAISQASASLLTEYLNNKSLSELIILPQEKTFQLLGIPISNNRTKCALLSYITIKQGLEEYQHKTKSPNQSKNQPNR